MRTNTLKIHKSLEKSDHVSENKLCVCDKSMDKICFLPIDPALKRNHLRLIHSGYNPSLKPF